MAKAENTQRRASKSSNTSTKSGAQAIKKSGEARQGRKRVAFSLRAPDASDVALAGAFNEWNASKHPMKKNASGEWSRQILLAPGSYQYKFVVDGDWTHDPKCAECVQNEHGTLNSVVKV